MSDLIEPPQAVVEEAAEPVVKRKKMVRRKPARKQVRSIRARFDRPADAGRPVGHCTDWTRSQVEVGQIEKKAPEQTGQTFNVWYHKWVRTRRLWSGCMRAQEAEWSFFTGWRRQIRQLQRVRHLTRRARPPVRTR